MFKRLHNNTNPVCFQFDGCMVEAEHGEPLAAALLAAGINRIRTSVVGNEPRAPFCLMGVCFECLVTIDGVPNCQSCLVEVREGMVVESQSGSSVLIKEDSL